MNKKTLSIAVMAALVSLGSYTLAGATPAAQRVYPPQRYFEPLDGNLPAVGASESGVYFLDTSSCYASTDGNVATLGALTYEVTGGGKRSPQTFVFKTYKEYGKRTIILDRVIAADGRSIAFDTDDQGAFLQYLFWQIAKYTGMDSSLD